MGQVEAGLSNRRSEGRTEQPAAVVVSRSLLTRSQALCLARFFNQPLQRWLLALREPVDQGFDRRFPPRVPTWLGAAEGSQAIGQRLDHSRNLSDLSSVQLGGAQLSADLLQADCVDALQLTLVPQLPGRPLQIWLTLGCTNARLPAALARRVLGQSEGVLRTSGKTSK